MVACCESVCKGVSKSPVGSLSIRISCSRPNVQSGLVFFSFLLSFLFSVWATFLYSFFVTMRIFQLFEYNLNKFKFWFDINGPCLQFQCYFCCGLVGFKKVKQSWPQTRLHKKPDKELFLTQCVTSRITIVKFLCSVWLNWRGLHCMFFPRIKKFLFKKNFRNWIPIRWNQWN